VADVVKSQQAGDAQGPNARVGTVIKGKWKIESLLGVGGMASVYAGAHRNGQRAALKILHTDFAREKTICERFLREAYVSNKVNHPATVQVLDDDQTEQGEPFLIMELLEGDTVRDAWKRAGRTMPVPQVLQICERVLDCLASCHAIGVIHRDLKPANIFITNAGEIKVLDFGVAQMRDATSERTATGTALGTPAYMSPEQAMGLVDQLDGRADLFSVGAMAHALITGHRINNGRTEQEALVMAATKPVPSVARIAQHLPIEVIQLVDKALAWDRRNRYASARDMQAATLEALAKQGAQPLPSYGRVPRPNEVVAPPPPPMPVPVAPAAPEPPPVAQGIPAASLPMTPGGAQPLLKQTAQARQSIVQPGVRASLLPGMQPVQPAPGGPEVPENDPRVQGLKDLMKHFDRVLPSVRQMGWNHPATERTMLTAFEAFAEALRHSPEIVDFTIRPYSFMRLGHAVWEPGPPFDAIPYNLFACGVRTLKMVPGLLYEEFRELMALFLLDPGRDLPPEDDLASAMWERGLTHIKYETVDAFAEGDAAEREAFYGEADAVEAQADEAAKAQANRLEARAMALSTDQRALEAGKVQSLFAVEEVVRGVVSSQFQMTSEMWSERYVDALVAGLLDAATNRDLPVVVASLRKSSADLVVAGRLNIVTRLHQAISDALVRKAPAPAQHEPIIASLSNGMFGGENFELILKRLKEEPSFAESLPYVLSYATSSELPLIFMVIREKLPPAPRQALLAFLEQIAGGLEQELGQAVIGADPETQAALMQLLARVGTPTARQALSALSQNEDVLLRLEARMLLAPSPDQMQGELSQMLENASAIVRMAALKASVRYGVRGVIPTVTRLSAAKNFNELGADERKEILRGLVALSPERGEPAVLDIAKKGGVLSSGEKETTRAIAAEVLGELSRSRAVAAALGEVAQARWGVSDEVRTAATNAARKITARIEGGG
jgi:hypothetical protein